MRRRLQTLFPTWAHRLLLAVTFLALPALPHLQPGRAALVVTILALYQLRALRIARINLLGTWRRGSRTFERYNLRVRRPRDFLAVPTVYAWWPVERTCVACFLGGFVQLEVLAELDRVGAFSAPGEVAGDLREAIEQRFVRPEVERCEPFEAGGMRFVVLQITGSYLDRPFRIVIAATARRGYRLALILKSDAARLDARGAIVLLEEAARRIALVDPETGSYRLQPPIGSAYRSEPLGISFDLTDSAWRRWYAPYERGRGFDFGVVHPAGYAAGVRARWLPVDSVRFELIASEVVRDWAGDPSGPAVRLVGEFEENGVARRRYDLPIRGGETDLDRILDICVSGGVVCEILVYSEPERGGLEGIADDLVGRLRIDRLVSAGEAPELPEADVALSVEALESITRSLLDVGKFGELERVAHEWLRLRPDSERAACHYLYSFSRSGRFAEGLERLRALEDRFAECVSIALFEDFFLAQLGHLEEAADIYARTNEKEPVPFPDFADFVDVLIRLGRHEEALSWIERRSGDYERGSLDRLRWRALRAAGRGEEVIEELEARVREHPGDVAAALDLGEQYLAAGEESRAVEWAKRLESSTAGRTAVAFLRGRAEFRLGWYAAARRTFEEVLRHDPTHAEARQWHEETLRRLGQASLRLVEVPIEPADLPVESQPDAATDLFPEEDAVVLDDLWGFRFEKGRAEIRTHRLRVLVRSERAAREWATLSLRFSPKHEGLFVNEMRVLDEGGEVVAELMREDLFLAEGQEGTDEKVLRVPAAGLAPGRILDVTVSWRQQFPQERLRCFRRVFGQDTAMLRAAVLLRGDVEGVRVEASQGLRVERREGRILVEGGPIEGGADWVYAAPIQRYRPLVRLAEPTPSWEEEIGWLAQRWSERLERSEEVDRFACERCEGAGDDGERVQRLFAWVQTRIRYLAISFGPRACVPDPVERTLKARYGDCKAKTLLLLHFLRAVGIEARPALVDTGGLEWPEVPDLAQFDHAIVFLPEASDGRFLDPTGWGQPASLPAPSHLQERRALVFDEAGAVRWETVPRLRPEDGPIRLERRIRWGADGALEVEEVFEVCGPFAGFLRRYLHQFESDELEERLAEQVGARVRGLCEARVLEHDAEACDPSARLRWSYRVRSGGGDGVGVETPVTWENFYFERGPERRHGPIRVRDPFTFHGRIVLEGMDTPEIAPRDVALEGAIRLSRTAVRESRRTIVKLEGRLEPADLPAECWPSFRRAVEAALDSFRLPLVHARARPAAGTQGASDAAAP